MPVSYTHLVVESDVGDDAHDRDDEVGGVQPSAQSRFDDGDLDVALVTVVAVSYTHLDVYKRQPYGCRWR